MAKIVILGAGMMGTAFSWPLADRGHDVCLVGTHLDDEIVRSIESNGVHPKLLLALPTNVRVFPNERLAEAAEGASAFALGVSSVGVRWAAERLAPWLDRDVPVCMVSKGLEWDGSTLSVLPDVFARALPEPPRAQAAPVAIAGPCIAGELARRVPTSVVFTGRSLEACEYWAQLSRGPYYHVWCSSDVVGVEACAALKNAYAMGVALPSGIHAAAGGTPGSLALHNYEASVFAQSIWEMQQLIQLLGGNPSQASWLPGVGDLDVTCNGGRTGRFGHLLGLGLGPQQAIEQMQGATLECLEVLKTLREALAAFEARGSVPRGAFPLAQHLMARALDGAAPEMPFQRFFGAGGTAAF
jgi:glycerol-3-phosphate dehydrogenase (NAD(P)+)